MTGSIPSTRRRGGTGVANVEASGIAITAKGGKYFADGGHKTAGYIEAVGKTRTVYSGGEIALPSSVALSPDQACSSLRNRKRDSPGVFQIGPDASLINGEPFYRPKCRREVG